jgi:protein YibB
MANLSIVTAFYDIGRGEWTPDKGHPHYLHRSNDVYIERFKRLTRLHNDITVFTSPDLVETLENACRDATSKVTIVAFDVLSIFSEMRERIRKIQQSPEFIEKINPSQVKNPEYWNENYVLVTNLKAIFPQIAISKKWVQNDMVAWIDFGYCRSDSNITKSQQWNYDFDPEKIHLFSYKDYDGTPIETVISNNDVYILGAKVVASAKMWTELNHLMTNSFYDLEAKNMVDDDQGLWLLSYISKPELFELHRIPDHQLGHDPFVLFNQFNETL